MEKPVPEKQDDPASLRTGGEAKRAVTISRLRETFSLRHTTETKSQGPNTTEPRRISPRQKRHVQCSGAPDSPCFQKCASGTGSSGPGGEAMRSRGGPCDRRDGAETEQDSGHSRTSAGPREGPGAPATGGRSGGVCAANSPEDRFSQGNAEASEKLPELDRRPADTERGSSHEDGGRQRRVSPPPVDASSPSTRRFKKDGIPLNPDVPQGLVIAKNTSASQVDVAVKISKKVVPLAFSMRSLAARIKQLRHQERPQEGEQNYRKFRAKICPGENQAAEDELRKEIR